MDANGHFPARARRVSDEMRARRAEVGRRLRAAREARGLSQEAVANSVNVSLRTYSRWEQGKTWPPDLTDLLDVATLLGADVADQLIASLPDGHGERLEQLLNAVREAARVEARQEARKEAERVALNVLAEEAERLAARGRRPQRSTSTGSGTRTEAPADPRAGMALP